MNVMDKHIVITGGGTGVGRALAESFAHAGAKVTIMGRREAPLRDTAKQHKFIGYVTCDVTEGDAVKSAFGQARGLNGPVDIVVANAGAADSVAFAKMTSKHLQDMLAVNLIGVANTWQAALNDMKNSGWGRLIAVASTAGLKGFPYVSAYAAAKHGVIGLTRSVALEVAEFGITANAICPGFIETPLLEQSVENIVAKTGKSAQAARKALMSGNPQNRFIEPQEVAETALWLCSDGARSVNGHALSLSGGEV